MEGIFFINSYIRIFGRLTLKKICKNNVQNTQLLELIF